MNTVRGDHLERFFVRSATLAARCRLQSLLLLDVEES